VAFVYPDRLPFGRAVPPGLFAERRRKLAARLAGAGYASALVIGTADEYGDLAYLTNHIPPRTETARLLLLSGGDSTLFARSWREDLVCVDRVEPPAALGSAPAPSLRLGAGEAPSQSGPDRSLKHPAEIEVLREAAVVGAIGLEAALACVLPEATEKHVAAAGVAAALRAGADDCRCRVRAEDGHPGPARWPDASDAVLESGRLVSIELTGANQGYRFQIARTARVGGDRGGEPPDRLEECAKAMALALRPGLAAAPALRRLLEAATATGLEVDPDLGGGIGLDLLEPPLLRPGAGDCLEPGQTVCLRLCAGALLHADMLLIEAGGAERLSSPFS
jgi:hypothetical protein